MIRAMRVTFLALMCAALFGCGGDGEGAEALGQEQELVQKGDDGIVACPDIYAPVCSVELKNIQCVTEPCPVGFYKTYPNRCTSDAAGAKFLNNDVCGDLEGKPYYDEKPIACTKEYNPVCAAETVNEPCTTLPCPAVRHTTFGNPCMARAAKAPVIHEGECGKLEGTPVTNLEGACPAVHDPVCGKDEGQIACITEPCPTHQYKTFGNSCEAGLALAAVVKDEECGKLEGVVAFAEPPVKTVAKLPGTDKTVTVDKVQFEGDRLFVTLGYSGCSPQHFDLYVSTRFMESYPVQSATVFVPRVEDACLAYFTTEFAYDLIPLKHAYQEAYQTQEGEINLRGIGVYKF